LRLGTAKGSEAPDPEQSTCSPRHFTGKNHLHDDVATQSTIFFGYPDTEKALLLELVPDFIRVIFFVRLQLAHQVLGELCVNPAVYSVAESGLFFCQIKVHI
jgi:hypothetical protein